MAVGDLYNMVCYSVDSGNNEKNVEGSMTFMIGYGKLLPWYPSSKWPPRLNIFILPYTSIILLVD